MAAPSGTVWGSIANSKGRIGIYTSTSSTNTVTTVSVEVWVWTRYACNDSSNSLYFTDNSTSAVNGKGSVSFRHTVNSSWSTSNQSKIYAYTGSYARSTATKTVYCAAKLTGIDWVDATMSVTTSYTIPALASYQVSYNANGGNGAPASQTKYYGINLTLSSAKPTLTGHSFQGWATSSTATTAAYAAGANYTVNAPLTLYAVWKANTYQVSYNANGGNGAPASQAKTYGMALTLSSTIPTRTNYNFLGWGTSASSTTVSYTAGANYTSNAAITLYAVWELAYTEPTITNLSAIRCADDGTADDYGTYIKVAFSWECDQNTGTNNIGAISIMHKATTATEWMTTTVTASGTSGSVSKIIGDGGISVDSAYSVQISATDSLGGTTTLTRTIGGASFPIDFLSGGKGVAFGLPATKEDTAEFNFKAEFNKNVTIEGKSLLDWFYPINSICVLYTDTSPAELFGGTWHRMESRFLWGCPSGSTIGLTAGEQTHTLTVSEMPSHDHEVRVGVVSGTGGGVNYITPAQVTQPTGGRNSIQSVVTGGGSAHNNMPPYVNVAIWRRTA